MTDDEETKISESKEDNDNLIDFLNNKKQNWKCPVCSSNSFEYTQTANPVTFPMIDMKKMRMDLTQGVPAYWIHCKNCFNITFFHKILLDDFQKINNKEQTEDNKK